MMCRGIASLVTSSNAPCARSLYAMLSSSRNVAFGSAAWTSFIIEKVSAASDSMPNPPAWARLRMLPTGVSTLREPVSATRPAMKAKVPLVTANRAECRVPLESQTNSFSTTRVPGDRLNDGAVDEANSDQPVGCGLDHVTLANRIADHDLNGNVVRTPEAAATDRRLNIADDLRERGRSGLALVRKLDAGRNKHWLRPRLPSNSGPAWCRRFRSVLPNATRSQKYLGAGSPRLPAETS